MRTVFTLLTVSLLCSVITTVSYNVRRDDDNCKCIFLAGTTQSKKLDALNYVCANFDCSPINQGGPDFIPNTIESHSAWAIDAWFQAHRDTPGVSCDFSGSAEIICEDCQCLFLPNATTTQMKVRMREGYKREGSHVFMCTDVLMYTNVY